MNRYKFIKYLKLFFLVTIFTQIIISNSNFSFSQRNKSLKTYVDFKQFFLPDLTPILEINFQFVAYSCNYLPIEGGLQAELFIKYELKDSLNKSFFSDAYRILSPIMRDSLVEDFYEVKRIQIPKGKYKFIIHVEDLNDKKDGIDAEMLVNIRESRENIDISDIIIAENIFKSKDENIFTKSGFDIYPRLSNYFSSYDLYLPIYFEIYNKSNIKTYGLKQSIVDKKKNVEIESLTRFTKIEVDKVLPIIRKIDISKLTTGDYELDFYILDNNMNIISKSSYNFEKNGTYQETLVSEENVVLDPAFQKSVSDDSLKYYISSLIPISTPAETKNIIRVLKTKNIEMYRKYLQNYWQVYSQNKNTYEDWLKYKAQVMLVERLYHSTNMEGYETDRGRVYLKYGAPSNIITRSVSSGEVPFEIWRYDKILNYSNRKFIFYDPDLINNYILLHSDVIGERKNPRWQQYIQKRGSYNTDVYDPKDGIYDGFGNKSGEFINQY